MSRHKRLVVFVTRRQALGKLSYEEAIQAGRIGLWKAILGYDPDKGYAFSTYAYPSITRRIWLAVKRADRAARTVAEPIPPQAIVTRDPEQIWEATGVEAALCDLVARLPKRLRFVIIARYGLDGKQPALYREIGAALGFSREWARLLHEEALVWLRHPAHSQHLRSLLDCHTLDDYERADDLAQRWLRHRRKGWYGPDYPRPT
jgi:RNA polymerase sigma factor (sigma-70 family)